MEQTRKNHAVPYIFDVGGANQETTGKQQQSCSLRDLQPHKVWKYLVLCPEIVLFVTLKYFLICTTSEQLNCSLRDLQHNSKWRKYLVLFSKIVIIVALECYFTTAEQQVCAIRNLQPYEGRHHLVLCPEIVVILPHVIC